jgi:hypothetical protein
VAREVFAVFARHSDQGSPGWRDAERRREWMRPWVAADPDSPSAPRPSGGRPVLAVMDYGHPGANRASANIGDHIQSVAALGHLVRHRRVRLHGREELVGLLTDLRERTRPERRLEDVDADLEVMTVHRDASMYEPVPPGTWVLAFGWFMHALFGMRYGFPLHANLRPIFVSFHCSKRGLLTPEAVAYLRRYGPVGCRDRTTTDLLLSLGVPAFFSGCLTTTIETVFPDRAERPAAGAPVAYVDVPAQDGGVAYRHSSGEVRERSFEANVAIAVDRLDTYSTRHSRVVTSRLHCYLPLRAMGVDVELHPKNPADVRYDGLVGVGEPEFGAMRDGLLAKLERVFTAILSGRSEADVYGLWREITAADVAAAEARRRGERTLPAPVEDVPARLARTVPKPVTPGRAGDAVHCAVVVPKGTGRRLPALVASVLEHASRPLHLWLLGLPGTGPVHRHVTDRFDEPAVSLLPARGLRRGLATPSGVRPSAETVLRLLLPDALADVDRLVVLPLAAIATADVAELADLDLGEHGLAAPRTHGRDEASGFGVIFAAADRLRDRPDAAAALRRTALARHAFDFDAFTHDVLVLDLERLRRERFSAQALALVREYGLDDTEVLHLLFGPDRATVPDRWAAVPTRMPPQGAGLIHWADGVKPWQAPLTPERELWRRYATDQRVRARTSAR